MFFCNEAVYREGEMEKYEGLVELLDMKIYSEDVLKESLEKTGMEKGVIHFIDSCVKFLLYLVLIMIVASGFGVDATSIVAVLGSIGLTIGLALQGSLSNFAGGVLILLQKPFVVGDYIREDTHGNEGTVSRISMIYTRLTTVANNTVVIPNAVLANSSLVNYTAAGERKADISVGISYSSDLKKAKEVLFNIADKDERIIKAQGINVFVRELADSSVNIGVRFFTRADDYWQTYWDFLENTKLELDKAGIVIPFPQVTVSYEKED